MLEESVDMKTALLLSHEEIQMFILIKPRTIIHTIENLEEVVFTISRYKLGANNVITMHEHEDHCIVI